MLSLPVHDVIRHGIVPFLVPWESYKLGQTCRELKFLLGEYPCRLNEFFHRRMNFYMDLDRQLNLSALEYIRWLELDQRYFLSQNWTPVQTLSEKKVSPMKTELESDLYYTLRFLERLDRDLEWLELSGKAGSVNVSYAPREEIHSLQRTCRSPYGTTFPVKAAPCKAYG